MADALTKPAPQGACQTCLYFDPIPHETRIIGVCREGPPNSTSEGEFRPGQWPGVRGTDWCGRYRFNGQSIWLAICQFCQKPMRFTAAEGWVHTESSQLYITVVGPDGRLRDDHCGTPTEVRRVS